MPNDYEVRVDLEVNDKSGRPLRRFKGNVDGATKSGQALSRGLGGVSRGLGGVASAALPVSLGIGAVGLAFSKSVGSAAQFEKSMAEVKTLIDGSPASFEALDEKVLQFSNRVGIASEKTVPALYQALSAGVPQDNVFAFLETANQAAVGGVTSLEKAVDGLTTVTNAFAAQQLSAEEASDILFQTVRGGKTTLDELSDFLFQAAPLAAAAGVRFEEVTASISTLTAQGTPTRVAFTGVRSAIQSLLKPSEDLTEIFNNAGFASGEAAVKQLGFADAANIVREATGGSIGRMTELLGSIEGVQAVLGITGEQSERFAEQLEAMENSAGAAGEAFDKVASTDAYKLEQAQARLSNLMTEFGSTVLPVVADGLSGFAEWVRIARGEVDFFNTTLEEFRQRSFSLDAEIRTNTESITVMGFELSRTGSETRAMFDQLNELNDTVTITQDSMFIATQEIRDHGFAVQETTDDIVAMTDAEIEAAAEIDNASASLSFAEQSLINTTAVANEMRWELENLGESFGNNTALPIIRNAQQMQAEFIALSAAAQAAILATVVDPLQLEADPDYINNIVSQRAADLRQIAQEQGRLLPETEEAIRERTGIRAPRDLAASRAEREAERQRRREQREREREQRETQRSLDRSTREFDRQNERSRVAGERRRQAEAREAERAERERMRNLRAFRQFTRDPEQYRLAVDTLRRRILDHQEAGVSEEFLIHEFTKGRAGLDTLTNEELAAFNAGGLSGFSYGEGFNLGRQRLLERAEAERAAQAEQADSTSAIQTASTRTTTRTRIPIGTTASGGNIYIEQVIVQGNILDGPQLLRIVRRAVDADAVVQGA